MNDLEFSTHKHYIPKRSSSNETANEEDFDDEPDVETEYDQSYEQVCDFLLSIPEIEESSQRILEGVSILQYSIKPEVPKPFMLTNEALAFLTNKECYFWIDTGTAYWKRSRHKLHSFYIVSFCLEEDNGDYVNYDTESHSAFYVFQNFHLYVMPWEQLGDFICSPRLEEYKKFYGGVCRLDYFTTGPWVDLLLHDVHLSRFLPSKMSLALTIHQNMIVDPQDNLFPCFCHIMRNRYYRSYINREQN